MDICKKVLKDSSSLDEKIQAAAVLGSIGFEEDETIALQKLIQSEKLSTDHMCGIARRLLQLEHTELARSLLMWAEENKGNKSAMRIEDLEVQLQLLHLGEDSRIDPMALALSEKIPERFRCSCIRYLLAHDRRENAVKCFHSLPSESGSFGAIFKDRIALSLLET
jgi:thioredoxin-like negative regulator of GroEL